MLGAHLVSSEGFPKTFIFPRGFGGPKVGNLIYPFTKTLSRNQENQENPGTPNNQFFMVISIGWFNIFTWEIVVEPNIH